MTQLSVRFEELIERHHDELYAYLWRMTDGAARTEAAVEVQDLVQDVFVRAYRAYPRLRPDSNFRAWLYKIATNCALTALKTRPRSVSLDKQEDTVSDDPARQPHREFAFHEAMDEVRLAILDLPPAQRAALVMRMLQGLDYTEIAAALDCSEDSARANVSHGVRRLRRALTSDLLLEME
jgi:RNA polymerase sigma-70 factor (ECF subfamily)